MKVLGVSYDLTIWKWAGNARATPDEIFDSIGQDEAHPAMQRFDLRAFVKDLDSAFGGEGEAPFTLDAADFTGTPANWITLNATYANLNETIRKLARLCTQHGLVLFDHQNEEFHCGT